jgi:hypothetical protein
MHGFLYCQILTGFISWNMHGLRNCQILRQVSFVGICMEFCIAKLPGTYSLRLTTGDRGGRGTRTAWTSWPASGYRCWCWGAAATPSATLHAAGATRPGACSASSSPTSALPCFCLLIALPLPAFCPFSLAVLFCCWLHFPPSSAAPLPPLFPFSPSLASLLPQKRNGGVESKMDGVRRFEAEQRMPGREPQSASEGSRGLCPPPFPLSLPRSPPSLHFPAASPPLSLLPQWEMDKDPPHCPPPPLSFLPQGEMN